LNKDKPPGSFTDAVKRLTRLTSELRYERIRKLLVAMLD
jgi:hypothetical protein